ncbi:MAG TPA: hypothetical protein VIC03_00395 [Gemmatimonadaceae bacterium]|jgi:hypothetical protein
MSDFRPRSSSEILDAAFEIYRRHFAVFVAINIFAAIPVAISSYIGQTAALLQQPDGLVTSSLVRLAGAFITPFTEGAMTCAASAAYLGMPVDFEKSVRTAFSRPGRLFVAMFTKWILLVFGLILFIVPGLFVFKRYFALPMTVLFEDNKVGDAISRSRELSSDNGARIFGLVGGVFVFTLLVTVVLTQTIASLSHAVAVTAVITLLVAAAISPFSTIVVTLLYYDIRIRKEGYDIELMTQALNANSPLQNTVS